MDDLLQTVRAGIVVAMKMKQAYWPNAPWDAITAERVGKKLAELKRVTRQFYPQADEVMFLDYLSAYSVVDIREALDQQPMGDVLLCKDADTDANLPQTKNTFLPMDSFTVLILPEMTP